MMLNSHLVEKIPEIFLRLHNLLPVFYLLILHMLLLQPKQTQDFCIFVHLYIHISSLGKHVQDTSVTISCVCVCVLYSLYDHLQGLSQRNGFVVEEVKVQLVAEVGGGL